MNKLLRSIAVMAVLATAACSEPTPTNTSSAAPAPAAGSPAPAVEPAMEPIATPLESLEKNLATDRVSTQVGQASGGLLSSNGKAGYLLFGPYVPFAAGTYTAAIKGRVDEVPSGKKIRLDVVSAKGKTVHGQIEVAQAGELPTFDFTVPQAVSDLEIRVLVPGGSKVTLESYRMDKKP